MRYEIRGPAVTAPLSIVGGLVTSSELKFLLGKPTQDVREYVDANKFELWAQDAHSWIRVLPCVPLSPANYNNLALSDGIKRRKNPSNIQG